MPSRLAVLSFAGAVAAVLALGVLVRPQSPKPSIFTGYINGVAVGGYDAVSYFVDDMPRPGRKDLTLTHTGVTWRFANEANRELFQRDPNRYSPQYGGYCAYAVATGGTGEGDPKHWNVVDSKLYLNASQRVKGKWERDIPGYVKKADANWPGVLMN